MISMEQAREGVDARVVCLMDNDEQASKMRALEDAALTCAGTDVPGRALAAQLHEDVLEVIMRAISTGDLSSAMSGALLRFFWLGFEFGRAAE